MAKQDGKRTKREKDRATAPPAASPRGVRAATVVPTTREELIEGWHEARRRRNEARLGSEDFEAACADVARIEVEIARIERAMDPPRV